MSDINSGGPAFPCDEFNSKLCSGMTLRDYFAAKAMPIAAVGRDDARRMAIRAYQMADAMLSAREVKS